MATYTRNARLTSDVIRGITLLIEAYGWTDITDHYGDADCDLVQKFYKENDHPLIQGSILTVVWLGEGTHKTIQSVTLKEEDATVLFATNVLGQEKMTNILVAALAWS